MNNRAIIAKKIHNGYFSAWVWSDGSPEKLYPILINYFKTYHEVDELLAYKNILGIYKTPEDDTNRVPDGQYKKLSNGIYVKCDDGCGKIVAGSMNGFVNRLDDLLKQGADFAYIFDSHTWSVYKNI